MLIASLPTPAAPVRFAEHTIATGLTGGYQVVPADLNHDGKPDIIALALDLPELIWFENPTWQRHVIAANLKSPVNLAVAAGATIVLASAFDMQAKRSTGIISILRPHADPSQPWTIQEIDRLPASHRLRWADIYGNHHPVVVNLPLTAATVDHPEDHAHTPLVLYRPGDWKREQISDAEEGVAHGIYITDWDSDGRDQILIGSFSGIHRHALDKTGRWTRTEIAKGDPAAWPNCGASDIAVGHLGKQRFLASIEPWHGNQVVLYRERAGEWQRHVIDDSLKDGHALLTADLNGDGADEIIAGYRGQGVNIYYAQDAEGAQWSRQVLDSSIAAAGCAIADLNGDGRPDIICIGSSTANLKWYENLGPRR